jgi:hypothetical protein
VKASFHSKDDLNISDLCKNRMLFNTVSPVYVGLFIILKVLVKLILIGIAKAKYSRDTTGYEGVVPKSIVIYFAISE